MVLDEEGDREVFLRLLESSNFPGRFAEMIVRLKQSLRDATVSDHPLEQNGPDDSAASGQVIRPARE